MLSWKILVFGWGLRASILASIHRVGGPRFPDMAEGGGSPGLDGPKVPNLAQLKQFMKGNILITDRGVLLSI